MDFPILNEISMQNSISLQGKFLDAIPLADLSGVGKATVERLSRLGIFNVQDLLLHFPMRYEDRTKITPLKDLAVGEYCSIEAQVVKAEVKFARRPMLLVTLSDNSGQMIMRFFNFNAGMHKSFIEGSRVRAFGEIKLGRGVMEMNHPEYQILNSGQSFQVAEFLTPIYPSTEGISQNMWRKLISQAIEILKKSAVEELLPTTCNPFKYQLKEALITLHCPSPEDFAQLRAVEHNAQKRVIFEELLSHHLAMLGINQHSKDLQAYALSEINALRTQFLENLPFVPTNAQLRVSNEIIQDLAKHHPMLRLVQGDVGSGKTLVAGLASIQALGQGLQVALMAPTEILAEQHLHNFKQWFEPLGISVGLLAGKIKGKARVNILEQIANGECQMVVGTHALFQEEVRFNRLALIIIDEQHRFGVQQRLQLREKGNFSTEANNIYPHQLIMTATPIPRTLAMAMYADLDLSIIDELPKGRTPIKTVVISEDRRSELIDRINHICMVEKRQAYWVCTLIEESEVLEAQAANNIFEGLHQALPQLKIGLVHGRMNAKEKQAVMEQFKAGELQLLVATTVIEVGVDVPNASLMIIENAERLGLSQLHQLRGRVGRGSEASFCVLMYKPPLGKISKERLEIMRSTNDGFLIAEKDLTLRGAGEILGFKQTGEINFKVANLMRDHYLINHVHSIATQLTKSHPQLIQPLIRRWINSAEITSYS